MIKCSSCGAENYPHFSICLECGADLTATESTVKIIKADRIKEKVVENKTLADEKKPLKLTRVKKKGASPAVDNPASGNNCPQCGAINPESFKFCGSCGFNLEKVSNEFELLLTFPSGRQLKQKCQNLVTLGVHEGDIHLYEEEGLPEGLFTVTMKDGRFDLKSGPFNPETIKDKLMLRANEQGEHELFHFRLQDVGNQLVFMIKPKGPIPTAMVELNDSESVALKFLNKKMEISNAVSGDLDIKTSVIVGLENKEAVLQGHFRSDFSVESEGNVEFWLGNYKVECRLVEVG